MHKDIDYDGKLALDGGIGDQNEGGQNEGGQLQVWNDVAGAVIRPLLTRYS